MRKEIQFLWGMSEMTENVGIIGTEYPVVCECGLEADEIWGCQKRKCPFYGSDAEIERQNREGE